MLRVPTADEDLYLKQCEPVQAFEVPLTVALAARWPDRVPEVVGADRERAWLLLRDGGTRVRESGDVVAYVRALELYGELQREEAARVDEFLALGLPDVRLPVVVAAYDSFFEDDCGLEREEVTRLRALTPRFRELCAELEAFGLPDSIQHDDLHDLNVLVRDGRVAIFDWGDSSVAHPLWSLVKPLRDAGDRGLDPEPLCAAYLSAWTAVAPEERLRAALRVAVPVGIFAYALQVRRLRGFLSVEARAAGGPYLAAQLRRLLAML